MADERSSSLNDLKKQENLLKKEYEYEKEIYRQNTLLKGMASAIRQGVCWYPVKIGNARYNSLNQYTVEIIRTEEEGIEHVFEYGRTVCFFRTDASGTQYYFNFSAVISYVYDNRMIVVLPGAQVLSGLKMSYNLGVQLFFDETSYKVMFDALHAVVEAKGNRTAYLREVLSGTLPTTFRDMHPLRFAWLNVSQEEAVNKVLASQEVAVVHGPPGTGKTTTLVEAVFETLRRENQVLVCAQSNTAVDWIAEKLVDRGISVLRIGNPTRVNDKMLAFTYERRFEAHPDYPELWQVRKSIRELQANLRKNRHSGHDRLYDHLLKLKSRATSLEIQIDAALFGEARVVASTLIGAANRLLDRKRFSTLFIDEAAQAMEAACWVAINKADRVILAGDHCQLPPTVKCPEAIRGGLGHTLLEKIVDKKPQCVSLLRIQYRMHEDIMRFSSDWFYNGKLQADLSVRFRSILDYESAITWIDTSEYDCSERYVAEGKGRLNIGEAELLVERLKAYMERIGVKRIMDESIDFGIISPYRSQVQYLRRLLKKDTFFNPLRHLVTVHTVDGFQGQERDVVIISLVRANERGEIGFLNDIRRMNVAITRARMKLIILGNVETLSRHAFYGALHAYIEKLNP